MSEDDTEREEEEARRFILARRARFVAAALAGAGLATAACGGESRGLDNPQPCLDIVQSGGMTGSGGASAGGTGGAGGAQPCLSIAMGGAGGLYASGGAPQVCLSPPMSGGTYGFGGTPPTVDAGDADAGDAAPNTGGLAGTGGLVGNGGVPQPCLSLPQMPADDEAKK